MAESQAQSEQRLDAGELFRRHGRFVANFLWKLGIGAQEIEDLVQEVFVVAHKGAASSSARLARRRGWQK